MDKSVVLGTLHRNRTICIDFCQGEYNFLIFNLEYFIKVLENAGSGSSSILNKLV